VGIPSPERNDVKTVGWKSFLAGFAIYFLATRPLLDYILPGAPILLGTESEPSASLLWITFLWHVLAAFAASLAAAAFARGQQPVAAIMMGAFLAILDGVRALRLSQDPGQRPGLLFMLILFSAVMAASTAAGLIVARVRKRNLP